MFCHGSVGWRVAVTCEFRTERGIPSLVYVCMIARLVGPSQFSYARNERIGRLTPLYSVGRVCLEVAMQVVLGGITLLVLVHWVTSHPNPF